MRDSLRGLWSRLLASCFQTRCVGCRAWGAEAVCAPCATTLPAFSPTTCSRCRGALSPCPLCDDQGALATVYAVAPYAGLLRDAVLGLKFEARHDLADWLGARMADALPPGSGHGVLVPVPMSAERLRQRGFNQAEWLARGMQRRRPDLQKASHWLSRPRHTPRQVGQGREDRWASMRDAFAAPRDVHGQRILLVDDVLTTGATLSWAADALRRAGAREVRAVVAGRAQLMQKAPPRG